MPAGYPNAVDDYLCGEYDVVARASRRSRTLDGGQVAGRPLK